MLWVALDNRLSIGICLLTTVINLIILAHHSHSVSSSDIKVLSSSIVCALNECVLLWKPHLGPNSRFTAFLSWCRSTLSSWQMQSLCTWTGSGSHWQKMIILNKYAIVFIAIHSAQNAQPLKLAHSEVNKYNCPIYLWSILLRIHCGNDLADEMLSGSVPMVTIFSSVSFRCRY